YVGGRLLRYAAMENAIRSTPWSPTIDPDTITTLETIAQRVLWLSTYMIHYANRVRPNPDGMKVGGHQASCASVVSLMTALYFARAIYRPGRRCPASRRQHTRSPRRSQCPRPE